ncbi:hypothetical protein BDE02_09G040200 [Populus trichocarpa]|nr:hypothetical protein BDE02_09G040200 [Populus trichocarpa]
MVLAQLGGNISRAIQQMSNATIIDEKALNDCLNEITRALLQSDVQFKLVRDMLISIKSYMESDPVKIGVERFKKENCDLIIVGTSGQHKQEAALFEEIRQVSEATKPELVIFVTDSSVGQVAFDQAQAFKQIVAVGAVIVTKMDGHAKGGGTLSALRRKILSFFIGTGEHMDEFEVFDVKPFVCRLLGMGDWSEFMDKIQEVVPMDQQPELLQKLSDGSFTLRIIIHQQVKEMKNERNCKEDNDAYESEKKIMKKYGRQGEDKWESMVDKEKTSGKVFSMLPGFSAELMPKGHEKESQVKIKRYMTMKDSMTNDELDSLNPKLMNESRMMRIARGAGRPIRDVWSEMKGLKIPEKGEMSSLSRNMNAQHMNKVLPPQMLKQLGGMGGLQNLMKQMGSAKDMTGMFGGGDK